MSVMRTMPIEQELREVAWIQRRNVQPRAELAGAAVPYIDEGEIGFGPPWSRPAQLATG